MSTPSELLETPPNSLVFGDVRLSLSRIVPGDAGRDLVPYYHFRILVANGSDAGHINFRVGDTEHVRLFAGHIGFEINKTFRGRGLAFDACRAIAPFVRRIYETVIITCDPDNHASMRTIEKLGANLIDEVTVGSHVSHCAGLRSKRRFRWKP